MSLNITNRTSSILNQTNLNPQIVFTIEGVSTVFTTASVTELIRIGDTDLYIGDTWKIGGSRGIPGQESWISLEGTTTSLSQQISQDRGSSSSVGSMQVALLDKNMGMTALISPGVEIDDILGKRGTISIGFEGCNYPEDYVKVFQGQISDVSAMAGKIVLTVDHADAKKRQKIFIRATTQLNGGINDSVTTLTVDDTSKFLVSSDGNFLTYVRIDDEIIQYTSTNSTQLLGCTRGQLGTNAASHSNNAEVESFYRLQGTPLECALKVMLSGESGNYVDSVPITKINHIEDDSFLQNAIYFNGIDLEQDYGIVAGDYFSISGSSYNNCTDKVISDVVKEDFGSFIVVTGITLTSETSPSGVTIAFKSKYQTLPDGLKMTPLDVDVPQHEFINNNFLSSVSYDLYMKDDVSGDDFLNKDIYLPVSVYAIPRRAKSSCGFTAEPLPGSSTTILSERNIKNPSKLTIRRSVGKNFFNTIVYKMDERALEDKYNTTTISIEGGSVTRIPVGVKSLDVVAKALRSGTGGITTATNSAERKLNRYGYGSEYVENIEVFLDVGFQIEIGDVVMLDSTNLSISNTRSGDRDAFQRLYEVGNKSLDIKTGQIRLTLIDTKFSTANRYGLISPSSILSSVIDSKNFIIQESYAGKYGVNEGRKWQVGFVVVVRNASSSVLSSANTISSIAGNKITLTNALDITPLAGYIMDVAKYNDCITTQTLLYGYMTNASAFDDGEPQYVQY